MWEADENQAVDVKCNQFYLYSLSWLLEKLESFAVRGDESMGSLSLRTSWRKRTG